MTPNQLVRRVLNAEPVDFNGESWILTAFEPCPGNCPQQALGRDCAGVVGLVNTDDDRFETSGLHIQAGTP